LIQDIVFYPVVCYVTGTTVNGGGIWKYILHASPFGLLRRNLPTLTQVLHFLDFNVRPQALQRWRKPLRNGYNDTFGLDYSAPIFADSGGYTLMFDPDLDLSVYGIPDKTLPESIIQLQVDLGATIVASLDYPIPPNLDPSEAQRRLKKTLANAVRSAVHLSTLGTNVSIPQLYVPIHGQTPEQIGKFAARVVAKFKSEGLTQYLHGLAVGSMVPLRKAGRVADILNFVRAARRNMPEEMPLHVFGVTGLLVPFLAEAGANSFDASGYVHYARTLQYISPDTYRPLRWRDLKHYESSSLVCSSRDIRMDKRIMDGKVKDRQKSEVYGAIALHNLQIDLDLVEQTRQAQTAKSLPRLLQELADRFDPAAAIYHECNGLDHSTQKSSFALPAPRIRTHKPDDFDIRKRDYRPKDSHQICLIVPCSQTKPYTESQSFKFVFSHIQKDVRSDAFDMVEVVFLSGLYGPVPCEFARETPVTTYDYLLHGKDSKGIKRVADRLIAFLDTHGDHFSSIVGYATLPPYREALCRASKRYTKLHVVPVLGRLGQTAFYRKENISRLTNTLLRVIATCE